MRDEAMRGEGGRVRGIGGGVREKGRGGGEEAEMRRGGAGVRRKDERLGRRGEE